MTTPVTDLLRCELPLQLAPMDPKAAQVQQSLPALQQMMKK